jgi:hypothetical protein
MNTSRREFLGGLGFATAGIAIGLSVVKNRISQKLLVQPTKLMWD